MRRPHLSALNSLSAARARVQDVPLAPLSLSLSLSCWVRRRTKTKTTPSANDDSRCAVIRSGEHANIKRNRPKLEKDKKHKLWVAQQRQRIALDNAETACEAEKDMARERYNNEAKKLKEEMVRRRRRPPPRHAAAAATPRHQPH